MCYLKLVFCFVLCFACLANKQNPIIEQLQDMLNDKQKFDAIEQSEFDEIKELIDSLSVCDIGQEILDEIKPLVDKLSKQNIGRDEFKRLLEEIRQKLANTCTRKPSVEQILPNGNSTHVVTQTNVAAQCNTKKIGNRKNHSVDDFENDRSE